MAKNCILSDGIDIENCILSGDTFAHRGSGENTTSITLKPLKIKAFRIWRFLRILAKIAIFSVRTDFKKGIWSMEIHQQV